MKELDRDKKTCYSLNMQKLIICKGLQACGKSTWARDYVNSHPNFKRINRDSLRAMLDNSKWSKENEAFIVNTRNILVGQALDRGFSVIVDDTNFAPANEEVLRNIAADYNAEVEVKEFDTPVKECIKRDSLREGIERVGERVILKTYNSWLAKPFVPRPIVPGLPWAVICDVDNTLALNHGRSPYTKDVAAYYEDDVNTAVAWAVKLFQICHTRPQLIILSGRMDCFQDVTRRWLIEKAGITDFQIFMRKTEDVRADFIVKKELYQAHVENKFNVRVWIDDRLQVVRMVREELGIDCWEVREGLF